MDSNCNNFQYLINKSIDKSLCENEFALLQNHLKQCKQCSDELKELSVTVSMLNELQNILVPEENPDFAARITARIQAEHNTRKPSANLILKYAAGFMIVALSSFFLLNHFNATKLTTGSQTKIMEAYAEDFNYFLEDNNDQTLADVPILKDFNTH